MSKDFIDFKAIKASITIKQVLDHYHLLDKFKPVGQGDGLTGPCPIHKGSNPTQFRVSLSKNVWNCFSDCKCGGNVLDLIAKLENVSIHAAALKARGWFSLNEGAIPVKEPPSTDTKPRESAQEPEENSTVVPFPGQTIEKGQPPKPQEVYVPNPPLKFTLEKLDRNHPYLHERGLNQETIINFGLGFCAKGLLKDHIAIPIHNVDGMVVAYAGRWPGEPPGELPKYKFPSGFRKAQELFNADRAFQEPPAKPLIIVEGFFGCMHLCQSGFTKTVALMGSSLSEAQEALIYANTTYTSNILLLLDEDEAGRKGREQIASRLCRFAYVRAHSFPKEGTQPDQLTPEEMSELIDPAGGNSE